MWGVSTVLLFLAINRGVTTESNDPKYEPTWESLDARPLPGWYDQGKIGIFIHWGIYSVPGFGGYTDYPNHYAEWFWNDWHYGTPQHVEFMQKKYPPNWTYQDFASEFHAEFYDPTKWAQLFQRAGAKYVVLTAKHHEGYSLYPSKYSFGWNSHDVGPHRDLVGDLAKAIRETTDMKFGLYHSAYEWTFANPLFKADADNKFFTDEFVRLKSLPELYELVNLYQPEIIWSDGAGDASSDYWKAKEFLSWLYNESPVASTVVANDRWGNETTCAHGGYFTCADNFNPGVLQPFKWENCFTLDKYAYGHRRNAKVEDYRTPHDVIRILTETISCGGNFLVNVGATAEGTISVLEEERLMQLGQWLEINGQAVYDSVPWQVQQDNGTAGVWYTYNGERRQIYAIVLNWPTTNAVYLGGVNESVVKSIDMLGSGHELEWMGVGEGIVVTLPPSNENPSKWAWTIVINEI